LAENAILRINSHGVAGARVRNSPGFENNLVIFILWGEQTVIYENSYTEDVYVPGLYWLRIRTEEGISGYIANRLVEPADL
jgi:hypothetical protein